MVKCFWSFCSPLNSTAQYSKYCCSKVTCRECMIQCASREMLFIHHRQVGFASKISQEKENKSHTLQPGNTLCISEVRSSTDGCQLGKHRSHLPAGERSSQHSWSYTPMVPVLSERWFKLWAGRHVCLAFDRLRIVCAHFYIYTALCRGQGRGSLRCPTQLSSACQKPSFIFQESLHMTQSLEFSFNQSKCPCPHVFGDLAKQTFSSAFRSLIHTQTPSVTKTEVY